MGVLKEDIQRAGVTEEDDIEADDQKKEFTHVRVKT